MEEMDPEHELRMIAAQLRRPHGDVGREVAQRLNDGNAEIYRNAIAALSVDVGAYVLEVGMGPGFFARDVLEATDATRYTGVDFSELMVSEAHDSNADLVAAGRAVFSVATADDLPFEDASFDAVLTVNTLYFFDPLDAVVTELHRVLIRGGILVVGVRPRRVMRQYPFVKYGFNMFSGDEVASCLEKGGFTVESITEHEEQPREFGDEMLAVASLIITARRTA